MKASYASKALSVLLSVAMCSMLVPTAAFATDGGAATDESSSAEQAQPVDQVEDSDANANSDDAPAAQSEAAGEQAAPSEEGAEAKVAEVNGGNYSSLQAAIDAAPARQR